MELLSVEDVGVLLDADLVDPGESLDDVAEVGGVVGFAHY